MTTATAPYAWSGGSQVRRLMRDPLGSLAIVCAVTLLAVFVVFPVLRVLAGFENKDALVHETFKKKAKNLKGIIVDTSFPNSMDFVAGLSGHFTPAQLHADLKQWAPAMENIEAVLAGRDIAD